MTTLETEKKNAIQVVLSENRLKGNFVSKFTVNLSKCNLKNAEISLLSKGLNLLQHAII